MKKTFAAKTFASRSFRSGNWTGLGVELAQAIPSDGWVANQRQTIFKANDRNTAWTAQQRKTTWKARGEE